MYSSTLTLPLLMALLKIRRGVTQQDEYQRITQSKTNSDALQTQYLPFDSHQSVIGMSGDLHLLVAALSIGDLHYDAHMLPSARSVHTPTHSNHCLVTR